jgi:hypothetical protein
LEEDDLRAQGKAVRTDPSGDELVGELIDALPPIVTMIPEGVEVGQQIVIGLFSVPFRAFGRKFLLADLKVVLVSVFHTLLQGPYLPFIGAVILFSILSLKGRNGKEKEEEKSEPQGCEGLLQVHTLTKIIQTSGPTSDGLMNGNMSGRVLKGLEA